MAKRRTEKIFQNREYEHQADDMYDVDEVLGWIKEAEEDMSDAESDPDMPASAFAFFDSVRPSLLSLRNEVANERKVSDRSFKRIGAIVDAIFKWTRED